MLQVTSNPWVGAGLEDIWKAWFQESRALGNYRKSWKSGEDFQDFLELPRALDSGEFRPDPSDLAWFDQPGQADLGGLSALKWAG